MKVYNKRSFFTNQKCFIITGHHLGFLTAFLNSKLFRFAFREYFPELLGDTRELSKIFFENVRVIKVDNKKNDFFSKLVEQIASLKIKGKDYSDCQNAIETELASLYSLSKEEQHLLRGNL